jgi:hypothetical protein
MACACTPEDLIVVPTGLCLGVPRQTTPSRWGFYNCNTSLPESDDPAVLGAAIKVIYDAGDMIITPELTSFAFNEPTYDEIQVSQCKTPLQLVATRSIAFEDRNKIDERTQSPFTGNEYFDYELWNYITTNQANLLPILIYCNGDAKIINRSFTLRTTLNYIPSSQAGGPMTEVKQMLMNFQGDPLNLSVVPTFNVVTSGFQLP